MQWGHGPIATRTGHTTGMLAGRRRAICHPDDNAGRAAPGRPRSRVPTASPPGAIFPRPHLLRVAGGHDSAKGATSAGDCIAHRSSIQHKILSDHGSWASRLPAHTTARIAPSSPIGQESPYGPEDCELAVGLALISIGLERDPGVIRLGQRTMHQASTLSDLHYQQLHNLARFADNPSALPWHVNFREGTVQITDSVSGGRP